MEITYTQNEISSVAARLLESPGSRVFLFYGAMGVGKTTLIKELAKQLGVGETSSSPSFSIVNEYSAGKEILYHFDFYRINNMAEVFDIGIEDYLYGNNYIFIEWPEKIEEILPKKAWKIYITKNPDESRTLKI